METAEEFLMGNPQSESAEDFLMADGEKEKLEESAEDFLGAGLARAPLPSVVTAEMLKGLMAGAPAAVKPPAPPVSSYNDPVARQKPRFLDRFTASGRGLQDIKESILEPVVELPRVTATDLSAEPGKGAKVTAGVSRAASNLAEFFLTPLGAATAGVGMLPRVAQRVVAGGFALDMGRHQDEAAQAFGTAVGEGDLEKGVETGIGLGFNTLFTAGAGTHAVAPNRRVPMARPVEEAKVEAAAAEAGKVSPELERALVEVEALRAAEDLRSAEEFLGEGPKAEDPNVVRLREEMAALESKAVKEEPAVEMTAEEYLRSNEDVTPGRAEMKGVGEFERPPDMVDWVEGSLGALRRLKPGEKSEWAEEWRQAQKTWPERFKEEGLAPDQAAETYAREHGLRSEDFGGEQFLQGLLETKAKRAGDLEAHRQEIGMRAQDFNFEEVLIGGKRKAKDAQVEQLGVDELAVGDVVLADGAPVTVERVKTRAGDETMVESVTMAGGSRFGRRVIPGGTTLRIDAGSLQRAKGDSGRVEMMEAWADRVIEEARGRVSSGLDPELMTAYGVKGGADLVRGYEYLREKMKALEMRTFPQARYDAMDQRARMLFLDEWHRPKDEIHQALRDLEKPYLAEVIPHYEDIWLTLPREHRATAGNDIREAIVFRGEMEAPAIKTVREMGGDSSRVSNSTYPRVEIELGNGAKFHEKVRISDHGQVSANAPQTYDVDIRVARVPRTAAQFRKLEPQLKEALRPLVEQIWAEQKGILENARPPKGPGGIKPKSDDMAQMPPDKPGANALRSEPESAADFLEGSSEAGGRQGGLEAWAERVIAAARGRLSSGLDPELLTAYGVKGAVILARGGVEAGTWATEMVREYGEGIRPYLPEIQKVAELIVQRGPVNQPAAAERTGPGELPGERRFPKQVDISSDISNEVRLKQGPRLYERRSNETDAALAGQMIERHGLESAGAVFKDEAQVMPEAVRTALGLELVKRWGQEEQIAALTKDAAREKAAVDAQVDLLEYVTERSTEIAQGLQAMNMWGRLTPAGQLGAARRVIEGAAAKKVGALRPGLENIRRVIEEENRRAVDDVVADPAVAPRVEAVIEGTLENRANAKLLLTRTIMGLWDSLWTESKVWQELVSERGMRVMEIAREHYANPHEPLAMTLRRELGINIKEAERLARQMDAEFARMVRKEALAAAKRAAVEEARLKARQRKISTEKSVWQREKEAVAQALVKAAASRLGTGRVTGPLEEFASRLGRQLRGELLKRLPERAGGVAKLSEEQVLREAALHPERYNEAWGQAQMELREAFKDRPADLAALDKVLGTVAPELFSTPAVDVLLRREMKAQGVEFKELVREHYTVAEATGKKLAEKIADRLGIEPERARWVAEAIEKRFAAMAAERKRTALKSLSVPARIGPTLARGLHEKLIELSNLGALSDRAFDGAVAERLKLPQWTREMAVEVKRRAEAIQKTPEGFQRQRKVVEMMNYLGRQKGVAFSDLAWSMWFANVLSGPMTHAVNAGANAMNLGAHVGYSIAATGGRGLPGMMSALARGLGKGGIEAAQLMQSGIVDGTRLQKPEALRALELAEFKGMASPLKVWRYVGRAMGAADLLFFKSAEELRFYTAAREIARTEKLSGPDLERRVVEILGRTQERMDAARAVADAEGLKGLDHKRRVGEVIEQSRPEMLRTNAREYALRVTFNQRPWGLIGKVAMAIEGLKREHSWLTPVAPFTNILANVLNEGLNYFPPVGATRAVRGHLHGELEGRAITDRQALYDQYAKATAGMVGLTGLAVLAAVFKDDEDPYFMVSGAGPRSVDQKRQLMETGWRPYSIKIGGKYYAYNWTTAAIPISVLGNYMDGVRFKELDETSLLNRTAYAFSQVGHVVMSQSFLSGLADIVTMVERDSTKRAGETMSRFLARAGSSFVVPNLFKQIDRVFDPTIYEARTVEANLVASVPFVRRAGKPALNVLGEPVRKYVGERFVSGAKGDAVWDALAAKRAWVSVPDRDTLVRGRPMTEDEYYRFVQESGQAIRRRLEGSLGRIAGARPEVAREIVQRIVREERERVKGKF